MSGIFGLFNLDGSPVDPAQLGDMAALLQRRGPDRCGEWQSGAVGIGHALLATTPEAERETLPLHHEPSGCVITADARLDNREELLADLGLRDRATALGDAEILLAAYLEWEESCVERFLGDFALAIWDPRHNTIFCARDQMGMRTLYYHHAPGRFFAFATEPRAILILPQTPYRINEARIADYLIQELEGVDKTSTFFEGVFRLPPAHSLSVTPLAFNIRRYWTLEPGTALRLPSDDDYVEAFLDVFTDAVRARLRGSGAVGSMLSGGLDSGIVVALARELAAAAGTGPLQTVSAVSPRGDADPETRAINAALTLEGLEPTTVSYEQLADLRPDLDRLTWEGDEPFDCHMTLVRCVDLVAHRRGLRTLLDGAGGDVVLSTGRRLARLIRSGHWRTAYSEALAQNRFWKGAYPPAPELLGSARVALVPHPVLQWARALRRPRSTALRLRASHVDEDFARRVDLARRLRELDGHLAHRPLANFGQDRAWAIDHPYLTVGRERYDRVAAATAIEPRDPFLDRRVVELCVRLPDQQLAGKGWEKLILRRATAGRLPDTVRWRQGKEHLGWAFTKALVAETQAELRSEFEANLIALAPYVRMEAVRSASEALVDASGDKLAEDDYNLLQLGMWLRRHSSRPRARS